MRMKSTVMKALSALLLVLVITAGHAAEKRPALELLALSLKKVAGLVEPLKEPAESVSTTIEVLRAEGISDDLKGRSARLTYQAPNRLLVEVTIDQTVAQLGWDRDELWVHVPEKKFGVIGRPGLARFSTAPEKRDQSSLSHAKLPVSRELLVLLPLLVELKEIEGGTVKGVECRVLEATAKPEGIAAMGLPTGTLTLWIRESDHLIARLGYREGERLNAEILLRDLHVGGLQPDSKWKLPAAEGTHVETTALSHLTRCLAVAADSIGRTIPPLGPATGERKVLATEGRGRLEEVDGTRVLFLKGTPEEMGRQHGTLMAREVRDLVDRVLYGVGVGSSFAKGRWFFGEIEEAQARLAPFIDERHFREMDAIALASGNDREELRLANFFPELFHCSGFAVFGDATRDGRMYHGRILDYMKGVGLEQNAVVMVMEPDAGNAWVNISYAGFVGSVTAMNEKKVAIGEMGGRGEGNWDGKPMAQLVREVMEKADTLEEAVEIMRVGPRTCEYFYVISDGKSGRAVGIAATPATFETVWPGTAHERLPHAVKDAVLLSAGDRYEKLVERVKAGYGRLDAASARDLMTRPVAMNSNIHSVLFAPESLDFWVANADSANPASHTRYTSYNLGDLLKEVVVRTE